MERTNARGRRLGLSPIALVFFAVMTLAGSASAECPPGYPYACGDGFCCPNSAPYCCGDGTCGASYDVCDGAADSCPPEYPYYCADGHCWDVPCGTGTIWPEEGSCAMGAPAPSSSSSRPGTSGSSTSGGALCVMGLALLGGLVRARRRASKVIQ